jgi:hypothetical protein
VSDDTDKRKGAAGDSPHAGDQGGEGNEGEGPTREQQPSDDAPAPSNPADAATQDDSDVEAVERGDADDVGTRAEEVKRAEQRERHAGEG